MKIRGTSQVLNRLKRVSSQATLQTKSAVVRNTDQIYAEAVANVPVLDGYLRGSGNTSYLNNQLTGVVAFGGTAAPYAPYVEFGTGNKFQASLYPGVKMDSLEAYALTFKKPTPKRKVNLPHRPFLFSAFAEHYQSMVNGIKNVSTKI